MAKTYNDGLARAAQEIARLAAYIGLDCPEGAAIAPRVDTGQAIRAIFALLEKEDTVERVERSMLTGEPIKREE
jgi:hypothetical protein